MASSRLPPAAAAVEIQIVAGDHELSGADRAEANFAASSLMVHLPSKVASLKCLCDQICA
jgi:hypothetical protein